MALIKNSKVKEIQNTIIKSEDFSLNDFKIELPESGNILIKISLRTLTKYSFCIREVNEDGISGIGNLFNNKPTKTYLQTVEVPGEVKREEYVACEDIQECITRFSNWLYYLQEDIENENIFENIDSIKTVDEFEEILNEKFPDEKQRFSEIEKENLLTKINELEERIKELEKSEENKQKLNILAITKQELNTYPKKAFWLKLFNRLNELNKGMIIINQLRENFNSLLEAFK